MIYSPALATIKLPLSDRLSVQQQSLGDSIYHDLSLFGGNAGLRHSLPFISAFSSLSYIVLNCTATTDYEAEL